MYVLLCILGFMAAYVFSLLMTSILYHRGLAHGAVEMTPALRWFAVNLGNWITGLDPKAWACMHRRHHRFSDTVKDPHSPTHVGIFGIFRKQLKSYQRTIVRLQKGDPDYCAEVEDLDFEISWLNRNRLWYLPYFVQLALALAVGVATGTTALALCIWAGLSSHPIQGWMVNAFGHSMGPRNFETPDDSTNNGLVALLTFGEGYQNNHHRYPASAKFSYRLTEFDGGYAACRFLEYVGALRIERRTLIPARGHASNPGKIPQNAA